MKPLKAILLLLLIIPCIGFSQYKKGGGNGLYGTGNNVVDQGWFFGIGATYMMPYSSYADNISGTDSETNLPTTTSYFAQPKTTFSKSFSSQFAALIEIGKFKMTNKKFINYMDYSLSWKWFRGGEDYRETTIKNNIVTSIEQRATFSDHLVSANLNLGYRFDATDDLFYLNGLGLNLDYHVLKSRGENPQIPNNDVYTAGPRALLGGLLGELHYFFGVGFKTKGRLMIMPMIETPILALLPFNHINSTHDYNNTRHRPFLIKVRFMFLKKGSVSCPAVYNPMGIDPNGNLTK
jgi:hypothetical protein